MNYFVLFIILNIVTVLTGIFNICILLAPLFKRRKPRIIPFNTYRQPEPESPKETPGNQCKILSFKYHNGFLTSPGNETGKCKITSFEYHNLENPGPWDHLP